MLHSGITTSARVGAVLIAGVAVLIGLLKLLEWQFGQAEVLEKDLLGSRLAS